MAAGLKGSRELQARLRAIKQAFKPIGRDWADRTVDQAQSRVRVNTGRLEKSIRRRNATQKRATVVGHFTANFEDAGAKPHPIKAKRARRLRFQSKGSIVYARAVNHPGMRGRPFKKQSAEVALRQTPMAEHLIELWNKAAQ